MHTPDPRQQIILHEQTKLLFQHLPFVLYGVIAASTGLVALLWNLEERANLLLWLIVVYVLTFVRWVARKHFMAQGAQFNTQHWLRTAILFTAASGILWGVAGVAFFTSDPVGLVALSIFLAAMIAGAVSSHACHTPAFAAFALPASIPFIVRCLWEGDSFHAVLGTVALVFVLINIHYGRNLQNMVIQSIRLRFQNAELLAELTLQKKVAEETSQAKTRFLAATSHDLRQPVQAIELLVDALNEDLAEHPSKYLLDHIQEAGRGLRRMLNTMLDSAKINAAAITPKPRQVELGPLLQRICKELEPMARHKGLQLRRAKTRAWAYADPALLELILHNYLENSLKYTVKGGVLVGCRRRGDHWRIEVHDTGIGIPAGSQETIFQEFYQLGNVDRDESKGLGLGLYIAQRLANLMNSKIGVRSVPGKGSTFHVTVPRGQGRQILEPAQGMDSNSSPLVGKTVLLIEDDDIVRASFTEMLNRWQCHTIAAEDAETALRILALRGTPPDAIVADYRLRNRSNGVEAVKKLQGHLGKIPAVILTGDTAAGKIQELEQSDCLVLHKPLSGVQLRNTLSGMMLQQQ